MRRLIDWAMWLMFLVSLIVTVLTMLVIFGKNHISQFPTLLPFEISLSITFMLWGTNSRFNLYIKHSSKPFAYSMILGSILVGFAVFGIY